jgi:hypothetical protein
VPAKLERLAQLIEFVVKQCAEVSENVGPTFQLGIHTHAGRLQLSDLMSSVNDCQWRPASRDYY